MIQFLVLVATVILGFVLVYTLKPKNQDYLKLLLAFSGAFLLSITVFDFIPEVFQSNSNDVGIYIMVGIVLQILLEYFSKGVEHGHIHANSKTQNFPWVLFISLCIHSLIEGFPVDAHHNLIYGIVLHKLPIAIVLSTFFLTSKIKTYKVLFFMIVFALMTPIGWYLSTVSDVIKNYYVEISALVVGIFLHISTTILFESNEGHKFNITKFLTIILAIIIAYFI